MKYFFWLILGLMLPATGMGAETHLTDQERAARFPADLGPATIDVSGYPDYQQQSYTMLTHACSVCHSPARAINSPLTTYDQWKRFVRRMHLRAQEQLLTKEDAKRLVQFLAYDSHERKVKDKKTFDALQTELNRRFAEVQKAKEQTSQENQPSIKEPAHYTGTP